MSHLALARRYEGHPTFGGWGTTVVEGFVPSLDRPFAPWVSRRALDRLFGSSHLPSEAGAHWSPVGPQPGVTLWQDEQRHGAPFPRQSRRIL